MVGTRTLPIYDEGKGKGKRKRKVLLALLLIDLKAEKGLTIVTLLLLQYTTLIGFLSLLNFENEQVGLESNAPRGYVTTHA
jgi:hypothetical protein